MSRSKRPSDRILLALREYGLAYPGAHKKSPWPGHFDLAVNDKTFAYLSLPGQPFSISCKLPHSNAVALSLPFTEPSGYGLGKSGWVTASFVDGELPPLDLLKSWLDESYRAQAPKKLSAALEGARQAEAAASRPAKRPRAAAGRTGQRKRGRAVPKHKR